MKKKRVKEFNSDNANQLGVKEMQEKLLTIPYIQKELSKYKEV
jgi:UDP-glucose 4-epimerase